MSMQGGLHLEAPRTINFSFAQSPIEGIANEKFCLMPSLSFLTIPLW